MISDQACEELAEMFVEFGCQLPDNLFPRLQKLKLRASHSLIIGAIKSNKQQYEETLARFHHWLEANSIGVSQPDDKT